jgi:hypothetical protein
MERISVLSHCKLLEDLKKNIYDFFDGRDDILPRVIKDLKRVSETICYATSIAKYELIRSSGIAQCYSHIYEIHEIRNTTNIKRLAKLLLNLFISLFYGGAYDISQANLSLVKQLGKKLLEKAKHPKKHLTNEVLRLLKYQDQAEEIIGSLRCIGAKPLHQAQLYMEAKAIFDRLTNATEELTDVVDELYTRLQIAETI